MKKIITLLFMFFIFHPAFAATPSRIVSLKPNVTDIIYALGLGENLVGITKYCDVPKGARRPEIVGDYTQPYIERIVAIAPDVVIGSKENSSKRSIETLERMGVKVVLFPFSTVAETLDSIRGISAELGLPEKGAAVAKSMEDEIFLLRKRWANATPLRVVIVWGTRPLIVAGPGSYMDELLGFIGATNAVHGTKIKYPKLGVEELIALDPDAMIDLSMGSEAQMQGLDSKPWDGISVLKAVRDKKVIRLGASSFRAGPGLPGALARLAEMIHN